MDRRSALKASGAMLALANAGCSSMPAMGHWIPLFDGKGLDAFNAVGTANWRVVGGILESDQGPGFLVSKQSFDNFRIRAEFFANADTNSGIFIRCQDPNKIGAANSYEVNIWDTRKDPTFGTAAIVDFAKVSEPFPKAAGRWNTFEITADGPRLVVVFNGQTTVDIRDSKYARGPIALQSSGGLIRFRRVLVQPI
ncbi:MAG: DUF1080 domain-containing protein [Burkholderiales bacterium]|nr:DUF1080 domain-containing protein [Burkholderiales bacterium]